MDNVILAPNDQDQELSQKIHETASQQNISASILQRNILCEIFNVPKDQTASTQYHLLHEIAYKQSIEQNTPVKSIVRSHLRDYFDMPVRSKLQYEKKGWPLQKREKRFQVLGFLVTVDAATRQEIADQLKTTKKSVDGVLSFNSHYFESFRIPYDKQHRWKVTELGKKDYFAIVKKEQTVNELKLEKAKVKEAKVEEAEKPNRRHTKPTEEAEAKTGIEKYFTPDPTNPLDAEIVRRLNALGRGVGSQEERFCKSILSKRLALRASSNFRGVDELIEKKLLERCKKKGKKRNDFVRELFCVHFNIKTDEVGLV